MHGMAPTVSQTQEVASALTRKIRTMGPGDKVGTVRTIAKDHRVSDDVARKALALLIRHGLVEAQARQHVVADPTAAQSWEEAVEDLRAQIAELRGQLSETPTRDDVDDLRQQLDALLAERSMDARPTTSATPRRSRRKTGT
jgi:DNA-binding transcriptional regulator YhcF (GntR family)